jgi:hypothetical protein
VGCQNTCAGKELRAVLKLLLSYKDDVMNNFKLFFNIQKYLLIALVLVGCSITNAEKNNNFYFVNKSGDNIFNKYFLFAEPFFEGKACINVNKKFGYIATEGKISIAPSYDYAIGFQNGFAVVGINNKLGFIDENAKFLLAPAFNEATSFINDYACISYDNNNYGYINKKGIVVVEPIYKNMSFVSEGLINVKNSEGKWGYIDTNNNILIGFNYEETTPFYEGLAFVKKDKKWGVINKKNETIVTPQFELAKIIDTHSILVLNRNKVVSIDNKNFITSNLYYSKSKFSNGIAVVMRNGKYGYIDKGGRIVVDFVYDFADECTDDLLNVGILKDNKINTLLITKFAKMKIKFDENISIGKFYNGLATFQDTINKKYGLITINNTIKIKPIFDMIYTFEDDMALIKLRNKFGFINNQGDIVIQPQFSLATPFANGFSVVTK